MRRKIRAQQGRLTEVRRKLKRTAVPLNILNNIIMIVSTTTQKFHAIIKYEDFYVQPLILSALSKKCLPESYQLVNSLSDLPASSSLFQWLQYESISFDTALRQPQHNLVNAYIIRKALIRKHYLSSTISHWLAKNPFSILKHHYKQGVGFELDYAEFLDDALDEAETWELRESWKSNEDKEVEEREWWILKPGMSDRGQGIRLFSLGEELKEIFEEWEDGEDGEDGEDEDDTAQDEDGKGTRISNILPPVEQSESRDHPTITNHLRHFVAQPYIHPPLLLPSSRNHKFHIRTYVLAVGALKIYVYKPMLALFAAAPYLPPWESQDLRIHLTNTCLQGTHILEGSVRLFWDLEDFITVPHPSPSNNPKDRTGQSTTWKDDVWQQICVITAETFEAASRVSSVHFQPLPNAFEIFGLDFLVDGSGRAWLLEVNAFPDFQQTGEELKEIVEGLFEEVVGVAVVPFFCGGEGAKSGTERMRLVLDLDLGRR